MDFLLPLLTSPIVKTQNVVITFKTLALVALVITATIATFYALKIGIAIQTKRGALRREQGITLLQLAGYVLFVVGALVSLQVAGISLTYFFVGSAALLVGLGFGLQQLFQDIVSGVILLLDRNINLGDVIHATEFKGRINRIGLRTTQLLTIDNVLIVIPNSKLLNAVLNNYAVNRGVARFRLLVPIAYNSEPAMVKELLIKTVLQHDAVQKSPPPTVIIRDFSESAVTFEVRVWFKELFQTENILSDLRYLIFDACRKANITIPVPQREIHVRNSVVSDVGSNDVKNAVVSPLSKPPARGGKNV